MLTLLALKYSGLSPFNQRTAGPRWIAFPGLLEPPAALPRYLKGAASESVPFLQSLANELLFRTRLQVSSYSNACIQFETDKDGKHIDL